MLLLVGLVLLAGGLRVLEDPDRPVLAADPAAAERVRPARPPGRARPPTPADPATPPAEQPVRRSTLPWGGRRIFDGRRFLVAYYGTGGTAALGVLGESRPAVMHQRLWRAAREFRTVGRPVQPVYELIVTVADATPGRDGDYSHDIDRAVVRRYIEAAHRRGALLLLDLQPGRTDFTTVARRWTWALRDPYVGLALDPEWRMGRREIPARTIGSVGVGEVNRTSAWLADLVRRKHLPEKLFVVHQFREDMIDRIGLVHRRPGLALVQHVDGFGTRAQKRATYATVQHARKFTMGFKLFYDEDVRRMGPAQVADLRPRVRFVSFQ